jgi:hypothetical protein
MYPFAENNSYAGNLEQYLPSSGKYFPEKGQTKQIQGGTNAKDWNNGYGSYFRDGTTGNSCPGG